MERPAAAVTTARANLGLDDTEARALVAESAQGLDTRGRCTAEEVAGGFPGSRYGSRTMPSASQ